MLRFISNQDIENAKKVTDCVGKHCAIFIGDATDHHPIYAFERSGAEDHGCSYIAFDLISKVDDFIIEDDDLKIDDRSLFL